MNQLNKIKRAIYYSNQLAAGLDPISGKELPKDSFINLDNMKNYFIFVSKTLSKNLEKVSMEVQRNENFLKPFKLTTEEKEKIYVSDRPIKPYALIKRINNMVDSKSMKKFSLTTLNRWLVENNFIDVHKEPYIINKSCYDINRLSKVIGIKKHSAIDKRTGEVKNTILLTKKAQEFIIENLDSII